MEPQRPLAAFHGPVIAVAGVLLLGACGDIREDRETRIRIALDGNADRSAFSSEAVWLVKESSLAENDRTAVFFGYGDNYSACVEFAEAYEKVFSAESYRCDTLE